VLLTAKAEALADTAPDAARAAALEANHLQPDFAPAALAAARALFRQNDVRKGAKILEAAWRAEPHPDIAGLYVHARPGDAVLDRLGRARKLQEMKKNHPESSLAVARAALEAGDFATARREAEAAIRMDRREGAYLLLADIEEAETGDEGKVRQLLAKAVRAPQDPAWIADGVTSERWAPASPVTGRIDAFRWLAPAERLGRLTRRRKRRSGDRSGSGGPGRAGTAGRAGHDRGRSRRRRAGAAGTGRPGTCLGRGRGGAGRTAAPAGRPRRRAGRRSRAAGRPLPPVLSRPERPLDGTRRCSTACFPS